jgi:hypothetical protein
MINDEQIIIEIVLDSELISDYELENRLFNAGLARMKFSK